MFSSVIFQFVYYKIVYMSKKKLGLMIFIAYFLSLFYAKYFWSSRTGPLSLSLFSLSLSLSLCDCNGVPTLTLTV